MTSLDPQKSDEEFLSEHLLSTSRTFALAIPLLEGQRQAQVGLSYLLFRVADSIEDAPQGDADTKMELLSAVSETIFPACEGKYQDCPACDSPVLSPSICQTECVSLAGLWPEQSPAGRLLHDFPRLMSIFHQSPTPIARIVGGAIKTTAAGMMGFLKKSSQSPNQIEVKSLTDLRLYCYVVAGIVGEMLTDIFVCHHPIDLALHGELRQQAVGFGEFLQLINILKDSRHDAANGRVFIPTDVSRDRIHEMAFQGRDEAQKYIRLLEERNFPSDIVRFCQFIYLLADGSLQKLRRHGAGSKLTREEVMQILSDVKSGCSQLPV